MANAPGKPVFAPNTAINSYSNGIHWVGEGGKRGEFISLISKGFDVSFNYKNAFYIISVIDEVDGQRKFGIGSDDGYSFDFPSIDDIPSTKLDDKTIEEIINSLDEDEIYF